MAEIRQPVLNHESWNLPVRGPENDPPASPSSDERWLVGQSPTGAWADNAGQVAWWDGEEWTFGNRRIRRNDWFQTDFDGKLDAEDALNLIVATILGGNGIEANYNAGTDILTISLATNIPVEGYADFNEITEPSNPDANKLRLWAESLGDFGQLHFKNSNGLDYQLGRDSIHTVRNVAGSAIPLGSCVYISGSTGAFPEVGLAKADSESTMPAMGIVVADIPDNSFGQVMTQGDIQGVDTSGFTEGDILYVSETTAGALTTTEPSGGNDIQRVGIVVNSGVGNGVIAVLIGGEFKPSTALAWLETQQGTPSQILARTRML